MPLHRRCLSVATRIQTESPQAQLSNGAPFTAVGGGMAATLAAERAASYYFDGIASLCLQRQRPRHALNRLHETPFRHGRITQHQCGAVAVVGVEVG
jgi:hypothetical protein